MQSITIPSFAVLTSRIAAEYKLELLYKKEFHEVFSENQEDPEFQPLLVRMKVVDKDGESSMDEAQWEAASTLFGPLSFHVIQYLSFFQISTSPSPSKNDNENPPTLAPFRHLLLHPSSCPMLICFPHKLQFTLPSCLFNISPQATNTCFKFAVS